MIQLFAELQPLIGEILTGFSITIIFLIFIFTKGKVNLTSYISQIKNICFLIQETIDNHKSPFTYDEHIDKAKNEAYAKILYHKNMKDSNLIDSKLIDNKITKTVVDKAVDIGLEKGSKALFKFVKGLF